MSKFSRLIGSGCAATASALLVFSALPAQASPTTNPGDPTPVAAPQATPTAAPVEPKRYCMKDTTNSRITKKICRTKAEWARSGVDIDSN